MAGSKPQHAKALDIKARSAFGLIEAVGVRAAVAFDHHTRIKTA
jgi:hypothetical protein